MLQEDVKLNFSEDVRARMAAAVMQSARRAIDYSNDRDEKFLMWDRQAEGDPYWAGIPPRWLNGCDIEDSMTDEHLFETVASIVYIARQQDWYQVTETEDTLESEDVATQIESLLNDVVVEAKLNSVHLYDLVENAARHSYAVLCIEWEQRFKTEYRPVYRHKQKKTIHETDSPEVQEDPDAYSLEEEVTEDIEHAGITARVPYTGDVYLDPPSSQSFSRQQGGARRIIERFEYTEDDLLNGVMDFGFDKEQVAALLKAGPTAYADRTYHSERDEIEGTGAEQETWEVLRILGSPPPMLTEDGKSELKEEERRREYQWFVCLSHNICFKFARSPYDARPYAKYPFRGRPGRMVGHSVCSMIGPLQQEATNALRFRFDFRDLYMSSPTLVPNRWYEEMQAFQMYPGALIPYPDNIPGLGPTSIQPYPFNPLGYQASVTDGNDIRARASQLFSADARGPAQTGERSALEVAQTASGADEKLDLFLMNFHMGVEETGQIILSHYRQFAPQEIRLKIGNQPLLVTREMLSKQFRIQATGSSENTSPVVRMGRLRMLLEFALRDPVLMQKVQQGDMTGVYALAMHAYRVLGIRNPEKFIGFEPTPPPNADYLLQMLLQVAQQYAQQGDPGCQFIMAQAHQMMASRQQGQPQGGGQGQQGRGQQGQGVSASVKYEDLAPNQQAQFAVQHLGLPPPQPMNPNGNGFGGGMR